MSICMSMCVFVQCSTDFRPEEVVRFLDLQIHILVIYLIWVLGTELRTSAKAGCCLNPRAIYLSAPNLCF